MPSNHGKQKQALKQKRKRELARERSRAERAALVPGSREMILRATTRPFGPAFVSRGWDLAGDRLAGLVSVVVTRVMPGGLSLVAVALVDRTCLGIKNTFVVGPLSEAELDALLESTGALFGGMERVDLLVAQSIVFHALDYAGSLGFEPHPDFEEVLFGPRPAELLDTPFARPARPSYVSGPNDNVLLVLRTLDRAVGRGNYHFIAEMPEALYAEELEEGAEMVEDD